MSKGFFYGCLVIFFIGILTLLFSFWAGVSTGSEPYNDLKCNENIYTENQTLIHKCTIARTGITIGEYGLIIALILIVFGFLASIVTGIMLKVDKKKKELK